MTKFLILGHLKAKDVDGGSHYFIYGSLSYLLRYEKDSDYILLPFKIVIQSVIFVNNATPVSAFFTVNQNN